MLLLVGGDISLTITGEGCATQCFLLVLFFNPSRAAISLQYTSKTQMGGSWSYVCQTRHA
jgi:hypothetical protein